MPRKHEPSQHKIILILDEHAIVRDGVARIIRSKFGEYQSKQVATHEEAVEAVNSHQPALLVADASHAGNDGIAFVRRLCAANRSLRVLVYSARDERIFGWSAVRCGARGFVSKKGPLTELAHAIRQVLAGARYISENMAPGLASAAPDHPPHERLSAREFQILCRLANGGSITRVATDLALSVKTVSTYRARVFAKLGFGNMTQLLRYAMDRGLA